MRERLESINKRIRIPEPELSGDSKLTLALKRFLPFAEVAFLVLVFAVFFLWSCTQRQNFSADENMRYSIAQYIYQYGKIPAGDDPLIRNAEWGISYAFNPILSYIVSAGLMKIVSFFTKNEWILLIAARMADVLFGVGFAYYVRQIAKKLFPDVWGWMFTFLTVFLPGNVILYSYVNCDSLAMFSCAMICYSWVVAAKEDWNWMNCVRLAVGMGLCFMSYYNAYGFILVSFFYFIFLYLIKGLNRENLQEMLKKGLVITAIVCVIALWWFIRNAILYDGDFLGRKTSSLCAEMYARWKFKPSNVETFQEQGQNLWTMVFYRPVYLEYCWLVTCMRSFVGAFGYNKLYLSNAITAIYLLFLFICIIGCIAYRGSLFYVKKNYKIARRAVGGRIETVRITSPAKEWKKKGILSWAFVVALLIPNYLNAYYSFTSDFQAQGRYSMPMLIPLMFFVTEGARRLCKEVSFLKKYQNIIAWMITAAAFALIVYTWARIIFPFYLMNWSGLHE